MIYVGADKFRRLNRGGNFIDVSRSEYEIHVSRSFENFISQMACRAAANADFGAIFFGFFKGADLAKKFMHGLFVHRAGVDEDEVGIGDISR